MKPGTHRHRGLPSLLGEHSVLGPQGVGLQGSWDLPVERWAGPPPSLLWRMTGDLGNWLGGRQPSTGLPLGMYPVTQEQMGLPWLLTIQSVNSPQGEGWQGEPGSCRFLL